MRRPPILLQKLCELSTSPPWRWAISASPHADGGRAEWEATCPPEQRRLRAATAGDAALLLGALAGAQNPPALSQLSLVDGQRLSVLCELESADTGRKLYPSFGPLNPNAAASGLRGVPLPTAADAFFSLIQGFEPCLSARPVGPAEEGLAKAVARHGCVAVAALR